MIHRIIRSLNLYKDTDSYYQIGLIALWEASLQYNPNKGSFVSYVYTTIRGRMLHHLHKEGTFSRRHASFDDPSLLEIEEEHHPPLEADIIASYCEHLAESEAKWVKAHFLEDKTIHEIAAAEKVSIDTVKTWKKRALRKLRDKLSLL